MRPERLSLHTNMGVRLVFLLLVFLFTHQLSKSENTAAQDVLRRIEELEKHDRLRQFEINSLRQENTAMASEIGELKEQELQQSKLQHFELNRIRQENTAMASEIGELKEQELQHSKLQQFEINKLRQENTAMASEIGELKEQGSQQSKRITALEEHVNKMTAQMATQMATQMVVNLQRTNDTEIKKEMDTKSDPVTQMIAAEVDAHQGIYNQSNDDSKDNTGTEIISQKSKKRIRQIQDQAPIAFFATVLKHQFHLGLHQPIVFSNTITNIGQALHVSSGIFSAPVPGVYVFSTTITVNGHEAHFEFTVNGKLVSQLFVQASVNNFQTVSQTVIFNLNQGDDVAVRNVDTDNWIYGEHLSSFSGFLLSQSSTTEPSQVVG